MSSIDFLLNNSEVVKSLYYHNPSTSADISCYTGKSIPHVIKILNELVKEGYVAENGYATSSGGRKPLNYSLVSDTHFLLSVSMDQFSTQMVIVDMNNRFITEVIRYEFDLLRSEPGTLVNYIKIFIKDSGVSKKNIIGIGLTMPGFVNTKEGVNYTFLKVADQTLVEYVQQRIKIPVFLENDSKAIALGEQKFGIASNVENVLVLNLGWGIGLGMILGGKIFRGNNGLAGEFSHIPLFKNGKLCKCGKHGCLETEASLIAVTATAKQGIAAGQITSLANYEVVDADVIINEAIKGDAYSVRLISEAAYHVGEGLAILIHLMNPAVIVLSGKGSVVGKLWLAPIQQAINEHCIPMLTQYTELVISNLNSKAQLLGAAALVVENFGKPLEAKLKAIKEISGSIN
ncbi:MAG: transcriptional regulator, MarR family [Pedobacter sp.]|nr:transcriptional regulator, MarR family [Pedobacter sp.]